MSHARVHDPNDAHATTLARHDDDEKRVAAAHGGVIEGLTTGSSAGYTLAHAWDKAPFVTGGGYMPCTLRNIPGYAGFAHDGGHAQTTSDYEFKLLTGQGVFGSRTLADSAC